MSRLTDAQSRAAQTLLGDLAISAGAGSGKTRVLAHRFANALTAKGPQQAIGIDDILTITFTVKAAGEISERVRRVLLSEGLDTEARHIDEAWISTIHGLCSRLLRRHALEAGVSPRFSVADETTAGVLKHEAWERSAIEFLSREEQAEELFNLFGALTLRSAVFSVVGQTRAMGVSLSDMRFVPTQLDEGGRQLAEEFVSLARSIGELKPTPTRKASLEALNTYAARLRRGDDDAIREIVAGPKLWRDDSAHGVDGSAATAQIDWLGACLVERDWAWVPEAFLHLVGAFLDEYQRVKSKREVLDFEDLQERTRVLLRQTSIATHYRKHFKLLMIDEFQDTNDLQLSVIEPLRTHNLCIVGDDKQSIYGWRYADVEIFKRMRDDADARETLDANFRTHEQVLAFTNALFSQSPFWPDYVELKARRQGPWVVPWPVDEPRVEISLVDTGERCAKEAATIEARIVADRIKALIEKGTTPGDIAILLRWTTYAGVFASALMECGIDSIQGAGGSFFDSREVADLRALLRVIAQPADDEAFTHVLMSDLVSISPDEMMRVRMCASDYTSLWEGAKKLVSETDEAGHQTLAWTVRTIDGLRSQAWRLGIAQLLRESVERFDFDLTLLSRGSVGKSAWATVQKLIRVAAEFERSHPADALAFERYLQLREEHTIQEAGGVVLSGDCGAVRIMTVHASKGLEFPVVVVPDLGRKIEMRRRETFVIGRPAEDGSVPIGFRVPLGPKTVESATRRRICEAENRSAIEEEKRVLYVACTRAEEVLILSGTTQAEDSRLGWLTENLKREEQGDTHCLGAARVRYQEIDAQDTLFSEASATDTSATSQPEYSEQQAECRGGDVETRRQSERGVVPRTVSYSSLSEFEACGFRFYARHVLGLRSTGIQDDSRAMVVGSAVHLTLQRVGGDSLSDEVIDAVTRSLDLSSEERIRCRAAAEAYLSSELRQRAESGDRVDREVPFSVDLGCTRLVGSIDLLSWSGRKALVVDYKTGQSQLESETLDAYRTQASCYALAAFKAGAEEVTAAFMRVECESETHEFTFKRSDAVDLEKEVATIVENIARGEFRELDTYDHRMCSACPALQGLCSIHFSADDPS